MIASQYCAGFCHIQLGLIILEARLSEHQNQKRHHKKRVVNDHTLLKGPIHFLCLLGFFCRVLFWHTSNFRDLESMFVLVNMALNPILFNKYLFVTTMHEVYWKCLQEPSAHCVKTICMWVWAPFPQGNIHVSLRPVSPTPHRGHPHGTRHSIHIWRLYVKTWTHL